MRRTRERNLWLMFPLFPAQCFWFPLESRVIFLIFFCQKKKHPCRFARLLLLLYCLFSISSAPPQPPSSLSALTGKNVVGAAGNRMWFGVGNLNFEKSTCGIDLRIKAAAVLGGGVVGRGQNPCRTFFWSSCSVQFGPSTRRYPSQQLEPVAPETHPN